MPLTIYGKKQVALAMAERGQHFIGAGILVKQQGGNGYVYLYLFCQGIEVLLKGFLLLKDYDYYKPLLRRFGHHLLRLSTETAQAYNLTPPSGSLLDELTELNNYYTQHLLRYASGLDLFIDPASIGYSRVLRRIYAATLLVHRRELLS